jgi:hypothetical protein
VRTWHLSCIPCGAAAACGRPPCAGDVPYYGCLLAVLPCHRVCSPIETHAAALELQRLKEQFPLVAELRAAEKLDSLAFRRADGQTDVAAS